MEGWVIGAVCGVVGHGRCNPQSYLLDYSPIFFLRSAETRVATSRSAVAGKDISRLSISRPPELETMEGIFCGGILICESI